MVEVSYRKAHWNYWISIWCLNRMAAYDLRNDLRKRGYHAETI